MTTNVSSSAIIYDERKRVLLAQRSSNRSLDPDLWETIGGGIEFGESPEDCLRREIKEELGCDITITHLQLFNVYNFSGGDIHLISIVYLVRIDGVPRINPGEIQKLQWVSEQEAMQLKFSVNCRQRIVDFFRSKANEGEVPETFFL